MPKKQKKIIIGLSGGVDSTMAAFLLKQSGYAVTGVTMSIWGKNSPRQAHLGSGCYGPGEKQDIADAKKAAQQIGIAHHIIDMRSEYQKQVLDYFKKEYSIGRTPNPCVMCNVKIKFGDLLKKTWNSGLRFDYFATGHYARITLHKKIGLYLLKKGIDPRKEQSYFLYQLKQNQLRRIIFPLGVMTKAVVKALAVKNGFGSYTLKKESQNFYECGHYTSLLGQGKPGPLIDHQGRHLGEHRGIGYYTVGQRKNLFLGGLPEPYYVLKIDTNNNIVVAGPKKYAYAKEIFINKTHWIIPTTLIKGNNIQAKIRYGAPAVPCILHITGQGVRLNFRQPQFAAAPGQSAVFYQDDVCLGGGEIS